MHELLLDAGILLFLTPVGWGVIILILFGLISAVGSLAKRTAVKAADIPLTEDAKQEAVRNAIQEAERRPQKE